MKRWNIFHYGLLSVLVGMGSSCTPPRNADAQPNPPKSVVEAITDADVDTGASYYAELNFEKGKASLDEKDSKAVSDMLARSIKVGEVKDVKVLGFSDQAYSGEFQQDFFKRQKKLADARNENIKKFIQSNYPQLNVDLYNMVSRPTTVESLVQESDANLRRTFEDAGMMIGNNLNSCAPRIVSKAIVVSIIKKSKE